MAISRTKRTCLPAVALALSVGGCLAYGAPAKADGKEPLRIAVIAEAQSVAGSSIPGAAQLAAEEINAHGGVDDRKIEITSYDNHSSAADSVRAFQRAVSEDHANAVIASYVSEVVLALEPWAARLKTIMITPGATSDVITQNIAKDYAANKYIFHGYLTSSAMARLICEAAKDLPVTTLKMKTAVIISEDAAWTTPLDSAYQECLPAVGLRVLDHIRFSPDTTDFTPIYNKVEALKPDVIVTGWSHVGVQPTVQWQNQQVPIAIYGRSSQATNSAFWKDTNGAAEGVTFWDLNSPGVAVTPRTLPFVEAYKKKFGEYPSYCGYTAYDEVYYLAEAVHRAGSLESDKLVTALEQTDFEGTIGRVQFLPKGDAHVHGLLTGGNSIKGLVVQWQKGKEVTVWPANLANGKLIFPSFVKLPH
jgi:branched-chain amino acid transport system substrate-binding protein